MDSISLVDAGLFSFSVSFLVRFGKLYDVYNLFISLNHQLYWNQDVHSTFIIYFSVYKVYSDPSFIRDYDNFFLFFLTSLLEGNQLH